MASERDSAVTSRFVTSVLPWLVGAAALLVYLSSLNPWVSLASLGTVARVSGWLWQAQLGEPLTGTVLYPFRFLPESWIPLAINLLAAVCAALALTLLARSVALLPHDIAPQQPFRAGAGSNHASLLTRHAWIPPVLAATVCGLQLSFWEQATSFTGEMIDLLVFAYVVRCLLEFRVSQDESWLSRCACAYGAGMANNWGMIGFLPVFAAALFVLKGGGRFFDRRFLLRLALFGLAGLSLDLLLPALHQFSASAHVDFWTALKAHLRSQKDALTSLRNPAFRVLALMSLLPLLVLSIRWKSHTVQFGDDSRVGVFLTRATVHFVHAIFFVIALWIGLDPTFSPRHLGLGMPMLCYYYLNAMVVGYCAGHFLLVGSRGVQSGQGLASARWEGGLEENKKPLSPALSPLAPRGERESKRAANRGFAQSWSFALRLLGQHRGKLAVSGVCALLAAMPLLLVWRNVDQVRTTNGPAVRGFARQLYADLPVGKSVALSDEPPQLYLLRAELGAHGHDKGLLLLDTRSLVSAEYQIFMAKRFKSRWPVTPPTNRLVAVTPRKMEDLISAFAAREPVVYLHPSSGLFFERFEDQPHGVVHYLAALPPLLGERAGVRGNAASDQPGFPRGRNLRAAVLEDQLVANKEAIWQERWKKSLAALTEQTRGKPQYGPAWAGALLSGLRLAREENATVLFLRATYSKSLNYWGVQMQRLGSWREAGVWFERAVELNPNNLAAQINAAFNERWQRGDKTRLKAAWVEKQFPEAFAKSSDWRQVLNDDGPVDEPTFLLRSGSVYQGGGHSRQAMLDFTRCAELAPNWVEPQLRLAQGYASLGDFAGALDYADRIQGQAQAQGGPALSRLLFCRTTALRGLGRTNEAAACIESFISQHREEREVLAVAAELYAQNRQFGEALAVLRELVKQDPNNPKLLATKGWAELEMAKYEGAIATLTAALSLAPSDEGARLHRAIAFLAAGRLDEARADYEELLKKTRNTQNALFGLGSVAWRKRDTNAAIEFYRQYLSNGIPESVQYAVVAERLRQMKR